MINQAIIIGGGLSIRPYLNQLKEVCNKNFTILTNYAYKDFEGTFLCFQDRNFYVPDYAKNYERPDSPRHPDVYTELKTLPLIVGINRNGVADYKLDNTILLDKDYRSDLTGIFALKILKLLQFKGEIYLLGFDWTRRTNLPERDPNYNPRSDLQIHYYDTKHKGSGYVGYYENHNPDNLFKQFLNNEWQVYNVNLESNINTFSKISYKQFFKQLPNKINNQDILREWVREGLCIK